MQSLGDGDVSSEVEIVFEARQDHQWDIYPYFVTEGEENEGEGASGNG